MWGCEGNEGGRDTSGGYVMGAEYWRFEGPGTLGQRHQSAFGRPRPVDGGNWETEDRPDYWRRR